LKTFFLYDEAMIKQIYFRNMFTSD